MVSKNQERGPWPGSKKASHEGKPMVTTVACGILVRGPHPTREGRLALIMAGPESLGTGAACLAATASSRIELVRDALSKKGIRLADKKARFWVLVRGEHNSQGMLDEEGVSVLDCGPL
jgi:hypothetical protein